jgi:hypothetical protein
VSWYRRWLHTSVPWVQSQVISHGTDCHRSRGFSRCFWFSSASRHAHLPPPLETCNSPDHVARTQCSSWGHMARHRVSKLIFWDLTPCNLLKADRRFERSLATCFTPVSCLPYSSTLNTKMICSSETSTTRCCIAGDGSLHNQRCELFLLSASRWFLVWLILRHWRQRRHIPPICRLTFNGLHGAISKKTELFI